MEIGQVSDAADTIPSVNNCDLTYHLHMLPNITFIDIIASINTNAAIIKYRLYEIIKSGILIVMFIVLFTS